jgi:hypothetical protein
MTVAQFLVKIADTVEAAPYRDRALAHDCRNFAMIAMNQAAEYDTRHGAPAVVAAPSKPAAHAAR